MISVTPILNDNMTTIVRATTYHLTDWEDVNVQAHFTGYSGTMLSRQVLNDWDIVSSNTYSGARTLKMSASRTAEGKYSRGWLYNIANKSYIGQTYIYFKTDEYDGVGTPEENHFRIYFYAPNGTEVLRISIGDMTNSVAGHRFECLDALGSEQRIYDVPADWDAPNFDEWCLVITHLYGNTMNYSLYNWSGDYRHGITASCRTSYDWQSWGSIYIDGNQGGNDGGAYYDAIEVWLDDIYITDDSFPMDAQDTHIEQFNQTLLNVSWTPPSSPMGGIDKYVIVGQYGAWPTNAYDGYEFANNSGTGNFSLINYTYNYYFKIFTWNSSYNIYSTGAALYWCAAEFNVYNGSDLSPQNFSFEISRLTAGYANSHVNSTPYVYELVNGGVNGTGCRITISNDTFADTVFNEDLVLYSYYRFFIYMFDDAQPAYITVLNEQGSPLANVVVDVYRNINGSYVLVSSDLTDSSGEVMFWLVYNVSHQFNLTLTDYSLEGSPYWTPTALDYTKTFIMNYTTEEPEIVTPGDCLTFTGTMYTNASIRIDYVDKCGNTTNASFTLGNIYDGVFSVNTTNSTSNNNTFTFWEENVNTSRYHCCILNLNHTKLGYIRNYRIYIAPLNLNRINESWIEQLFDDVLGDWDFGWAIFFLIYIPALLFIISFGSMGHPGLGVLSGGGWVLFVNSYVLFGLEATFATIGAVLIVLGILAIMTKKGRSLVQ
jgi:hypothetical protein